MTIPNKLVHKFFRLCPVLKKTWCQLQLSRGVGFNSTKGTMVSCGFGVCDHVELGQVEWCFPMCAVLLSGGAMPGMVGVFWLLGWWP